MKQSLADPCVFYKRNKSGRTVLIAIFYVGNMLLFGLRTKTMSGISKESRPDLGTRIWEDFANT
jgi:hypothetical protein